MVSLSAWFVGFHFVSCGAGTRRIGMEFAPSPCLCVFGFSLRLGGGSSHFTLW